MEREIKYRCWIERYKEFKYWGFIGNNFIGAPTGSGLSIEECKAFSQQYTEIKDKEGKEIYDGDTVKLHIFTQEFGENLGITEGELELTGNIEIHPMGVYFNCISKDDSLSAFLLEYNLHEESLEIIGNIYENPKLLK